jgi:transketolase
MQYQFIPQEEFIRVEEGLHDVRARLPLIAKMCRLNTLVEVKLAGSGHLGSSFSAMDIVVYLYYHHMNTRKVGIDDPNRDVYFSSKGHDVPGLYSVLYSAGIIPERLFLRLRRIGGLDGHPDIRHPGIEANSGSLGMGISKAKGIAFAKKYFGRKGRVFVLTGDGEFQEGQNYEALLSARQQDITNLTVIMDHNKLQSDRYVDRIVSLGDLEKKVRDFGWHVQRCYGHDFGEIGTCLESLEQAADSPKFLICDTVKGKGVSFMEHPRALELSGGLYKWHAGAPSDEDFSRAFDELLASLREDYALCNLGSLSLKPSLAEKKVASFASAEYVSKAYGEALLACAQEREDFVVLDADLSGDCRILEFEKKYPQRFIECGIAEQDMVSMAGGMALQGLIPVVNSFASFLASRSNEQIFNNLTEGNKVIYACHYAGLIPAGPGKSHQSIRDISLFGAFPNCTIIEPANSQEMQDAVRYALWISSESVMLRIPIGPSPRTIDLPAEYKFVQGQGTVLTTGRSDVCLVYGPVMLHEALLAAELLATENRLSLKVVNLPWINRFDRQWLEDNLQGCRNLFIVEDHSPFGGLADHLADFLVRTKLLARMRMHKFAVNGFPEFGTPEEVLRHHRLNGASIAERILESRKTAAEDD